MFHHHVQREEPTAAEGRPKRISRKRPAGADKPMARPPPAPDGGLPNLEPPAKKRRIIKVLQIKISF